MKQAECRGIPLLKKMSPVGPMGRPVRNGAKAVCFPITVRPLQAPDARGRFRSAGMRCETGSGFRIPDMS